MVDPLLCNKHLMSYKCTGGGTTPYLYDVSPFFLGYSTAQLNESATNCLKVRRDSDNDELDIGFSGRWIDTAAIATFCGAANGFVTTWYDQGASGRNASQVSASAQLSIYNGSSVYTDNGKPCLKGGTARVLTTANFGLQAQPNTWFSVCQFEAVPVASYLFYGGTSNVENIWTRTNEYRLGTDTGSILDATDHEDVQGLVTGLHNGASSTLRWNGVEAVVGNPGADGIESLLIANFADTRPLQCIQEFIMYNDDQTANYTSIEENMNQRFGVYA